MRNQIQIALIAFASMAGVVAGASTYKWVGAEGYQPFSQLKSWALEDGTPAVRLPGAEDALADGASYSFDLEGKNVSLSSWNAVKNWERYALNVRNGRLQLEGLSVVHGGPSEIEKGGVLSFGPKSTFAVAVNDGASRHIVVKDGGKLEFSPESKLEIYNICVDVQPGGEANFDFGEAWISGGSQKSRFLNRGTMIFPKGFTLSRKTQNEATVEFVQEAGATMVLSGKFSSGPNQTKMRFVLNGGTIKIPYGADISECEVVIPEGANPVFDIDTNQRLRFPSGYTGAGFVKRGNGILETGTQLPANLVVESGALAICAPGKVQNLETVKFRKGSFLLLASRGIEIDALPEGVSLAFQFSVLQNGDTVLVSKNPEVRNAVLKENTDLPKGLYLKETGHALVLDSRNVAVKSGDWNNPSIWKTGKIPEKGHFVTISGKNVQVSLPSGMQERDCASILLKDGARLVIDENMELPFVNMLGASQLIVRKGTCFLKKGFAAAEDASGVPEICIRKGAAIISTEGASFGAAKVQREGKLLLEAKGALRSWTDLYNRSFWVDASDVSTNGVSYTFISRNFADVPVLTKGNTRRETVGAPFWRGRIGKGQTQPFRVRVLIEMKDGTTLFKDGMVTPMEKPYQPAFANEDIMIGLTVYAGDKAMPQFREEIIRDELCNLLVSWPRGEIFDPKNMPPELVKKAKEDDLRFMTIYSWDSAPQVEANRAAWGKNYLFNNIGEYAGYLYQWITEAKAVGCPQDMDLREAKNQFVDQFIPRAVRQNRQFDYIFSTSGSPLANYELQGGIGFICNELYAVGSANLAYASSEARGAARRWGPEYWSAWNAQEWQTFPVPYASNQNYDMLLAGLYQQYTMGTSLIVLESGADFTQAHNYKSVYGDDSKPGNLNVRQGYDGDAPRRYRQTIKKFYDFLRANPREKGTPETQIAFILGEGGAFVGMTHPGFAMWGQHEQALTNNNWRCGPPEQTWNTIKQTFMPTPGDNLAPYPNYWLAGSPFGQTDVICVDEDAFYADISRYKLLSFAGWNTMTPEARAVLNHYVEEGGTLVDGLPYNSTRSDREYFNYTAEDLIPEAAALVEAEPRFASGTIRFTEKAEELLPQIGKFFPKEGVQIQNLKLATLQKDQQKDWIPVVTVDDIPLIVMRREKRGTRYFMLSWAYPGENNPLAQTYRALLSGLAKEVRQRVTIEPVPGENDDTKYICYAAYGKAAYFVNMDCVKPRKVTAVINGTSQILELPPCSIRKIYF